MINIEKVTVDKLRLYRGRPVKINDSISMRIPTIGDISDYGEEKYYSMIYNLCSVGIDLCWQLEEVGIKFDEISDYELFVNILCKNYNTDQTKIIFGNKLKFQKMKTCFNTENKSIVLCQTYLISIPLKKSPSLKSDNNLVIKSSRGSESSHSKKGFFPDSFSISIPFA